MTDANFDLSKLKVGDIFNYIPLKIRESKDPIDFINRTGAAFIAWATRGRFNHTSQVVAILEGPTILITEALPKLGVYTKEFNPKWLPNITIFRVNCFPEEAVEAASWWRSKSGCKYNTIAAGLAGLRTFFNFDRLGKLIIKIKNKFFCSNGVALGFAFASANIKIADCDPSQCTPSDIGRNGKYVLEVT